MRLHFTLGLIATLWACAAPADHAPSGAGASGAAGHGPVLMDSGAQTDGAAGRDADTARDGGAFGGRDAARTDAAALDAATSDGGTQPHYSAQPLLGPSYMGSVSNSVACSKSYPTRGFEPEGAVGARYPLFLYFVGTAFVATDPSAAHDNPAALAVTDAMARRGFVALSVAYDNDALAWLSDHQNQLTCLFDALQPQSLVAAACALPQVDCALGIATWGHSQGGYVGVAAHAREPRVRAAWATGYGGDASTTLSPNRLRVVNGEADAGDNGTATKLQTITGLSAAECPEPDQCLRADGSGYIIVRVADLAAPQTSSADHCWFDRTSCGASSITLEPNWVNPTSDKAFALERNADWVAATTARAP